MDQSRIDRALGRIEGALARIERAASGRTGDGTLRKQVTAVLGELDTLIESLER